jgi:hypothetical protein
LAPAVGVDCQAGSFGVRNRLTAAAAIALKPSAITTLRSRCVFFGASISPFSAALVALPRFDVSSTTGSAAAASATSALLIFGSTSSLKRSRAFSAASVVAGPTLCNASSTTGLTLSTAALAAVAPRSTAFSAYGLALSFALLTTGPTF